MTTFGTPFLLVSYLKTNLAVTRVLVSLILRFQVLSILVKFCKDVYANSPLLFVTGSSSNHVFANINCMYSIVAADANASIVFINFGLSGHELRVLKKHFSLIHSLHVSLNSSAQIYYRVFNFNNFPNWISINNYYVGGYAWKVISYMDVLREVHGPLLWTDAGSVLNGTMTQEMSYMHDYGVYSPYSSGDIATWVHNASISFLQTHHMINSVDPFALMCTGGYLFIDGSNATIMKRVFGPLFECAFTKKCISPDLTNRNNHRQDQAILTMLLHSSRSREILYKGIYISPGIAKGLCFIVITVTRFSSRYGNVFVSNMIFHVDVCFLSLLL